jgi:hypothetical protein
MPRKKQDCPKRMKCKLFPIFSFHCVYYHHPLLHTRLLVFIYFCFHVTLPPPPLERHTVDDGSVDADAGCCVCVLIAVITYCLIGLRLERKIGEEQVSKKERQLLKMSLVEDVESLQLHEILRDKRQQVTACSMVTSTNGWHNLSSRLE